MKPRMLRLLLALGLLLISQGAWSACTLSSKDVQKDIDKNGAKKVLWTFGKNDDAYWASFTDCIQTGEKSWLHIAVEVAPYRDGFVGEDLALALGRALAIDAEVVLLTVVPAYSEDEFCGMLDNDGPPGAEPYLKELDARERGLEKVKAANLQDSVQSCRTAIETTRDYVKTHLPG